MVDTSSMPSVFSSSMVTKMGHGALGSVNPWVIFWFVLEDSCFYSLSVVSINCTLLPWLTIWMISNIAVCG